MRHCWLRTSRESGLSRVFFTTLWICSTSSEPVVDIPDYGRVVGIAKTDEVTYSLVETFRGVPFAEPPTGPKRYRPPQILKRSERDGDINATTLGAPCPQPEEMMYDPKENATEDCLHLRIWRPARDYSPSDPLIPVVIVIVGGAFVAGDSSEIKWDGTSLSAMGDMVVVVPNYRLGILGFLDMGFVDDGTDDSVMGNVGLLDQRLAMVWVRDNIRYFGGDPEKVTLMGNSAGSISITLHMLTPESWGLYRAVLLDSGVACPGHIETSGESSHRGRKVADLLGCDNSSLKTQIECLKNADAQELMRVQALTQRLLFSFRPSIPNSVLSFTTDRQINSYQFQGIPIMIGSTVDDGSYIYNLLKPNGTGRLNMSTFLDAVDEFAEAPNFWGNFNYSKVLHEFNVTDHMTDEESRFKLTDFLTDVLFACATVNFAIRHSELKTSRTFLYEWSRRSDSKAFGDSEKDGAFHGLSFYHLYGSLLEAHDLSKADEAYAKMAIRAVIDFIHDPYTNPIANGVEWKPFLSYSEGEKYVMRFEQDGPKLTVGHPREKVCDEVFLFHSKNSKFFILLPEVLKKLLR